MQYVRDNIAQMGGYISGEQPQSGDFIKYCFRPINLYFYYQSEVFDIKGLGQLAFGIGTIAYSWNKIGLEFGFIPCLKLVIFLITASLVMLLMG